MYAVLNVNSVSEIELNFQLSSIQIFTQKSGNYNTKSKIQFLLGSPFQSIIYLW